MDMDLSNLTTPSVFESHMYFSPVAPITGNGLSIKNPRVQQYRLVMRRSGEYNLVLIVGQLTVVVVVVVVVVVLTLTVQVLVVVAEVVVDLVVVVLVMVVAVVVVVMVVVSVVVAVTVAVLVDVEVF